jgi:hypothetical protein
LCAEKTVASETKRRHKEYGRRDHWPRFGFLGGGRHKTDDEIDYAVGFSKIKKIGEMVVRNEPLFFVHARTEHSLNSVMPLLEKAIEVR